MRKERAAPGLVSSLPNQPPLLSRSAVLSSLAEPSTNYSAQLHLAQDDDRCVTRADAPSWGRALASAGL